MTLFQFSLRASRWGKNHVSVARFLIVCSHLLLTALALWSGLVFAQHSITISNNVFLGALFFFMMALLLYPSKSKRNFIQQYKYQKSCDLVLVATTFLMILQVGNQFSNQDLPSISSFQNTVQASMLSKPSDGSLTNKVTTPPHKLSWKEKIQLKKNLIRKYFEQEKEYSDGEKVGYTILGILGATLLLFLVVILACNLSCSGAEGLAIMVAIVGTSGIIFLLALLFKELFGKKKSSHEVASL